jgi:hypothetical protein
MMNEKMKVKCIKIHNEDQQESHSKRAWLAIGNEYLFSAIEVTK